MKQTAEGEADCRIGAKFRNFAPRLEFEGATRFRKYQPTAIARFGSLTNKSHCLQTKLDPDSTPRSDAGTARLPVATWQLLRLVGRVYLILWMTAVRGLVLANVAGLLGMFFAEENKAELVRPWMHTG